jgi:DNA invertase Pin-like site-specific DNA recombinase
MLGAIAQFETEIRAERQLDGIANARARGVAFGRRPALTPEQVTDLRERRRQGVLIKDLMAEYGLGKTALYRYLGGTEPALLSSTDADSIPEGMQHVQYTP